MSILNGTVKQFNKIPAVTRHAPCQVYISASNLKISVDKGAQIAAPRKRSGLIACLRLSNHCLQEAAIIELNRPADNMINNQVAKFERILF